MTRNKIYLNLPMMTGDNAPMPPLAAPLKIFHKIPKDFRVVSQTLESTTVSGGRGHIPQTSVDIRKLD